MLGWQMRAAERWVLYAFLAVLLALNLYMLLQIKQGNDSARSNSKADQVMASLIIPPGVISGTALEPQKIDATITIPKTENSMPVQQTIAVILAGVFTLLGSAVVLMFNHIGTNSARTFEWGKHLWDQYHESYLSLRNAIKSTTDSNMIDEAVRDISKRVIIPPRLERELHDLVSALKMEQSPIAKREKCDAFLKVFEGFVSKPWTYL